MFRFFKFFTITFLFPLFSLHSLFAAITFTGLTTADFQSASCIADPGGQDVGLPQAFPTGEISGFDIRSVCLSYDPANDTLYVGIETYTDISNQNIIFGDADGDGDPAGSSVTLQTLLGTDQADLSGQEFFTLTLDLDGDGTPDLVTGTHNENSLNEFQAVSGVAAPDNNLLLGSLKRFYGTAMAGVSATLDHLPTGDKPHLEFSISGISKVPVLSGFYLSDPNSFFQLTITTGSFDDDGISEEYFPNIATYRRIESGFFRDSDGDTINDLFDADNDNDTIPDFVEQGLSLLDADGSGSLDADEIFDSGLDLDLDGDIDTNDIGAWSDTDGDGTADYLDTDSDGDAILDSLEVGSDPSNPRDSDNDGVYDFLTADSDGDGLLDGQEDANHNGIVDAGETDPTKPEVGASIAIANVGSGGGGGERPLSVSGSTSTGTSNNSSSQGTLLGGDVDLTKGTVGLQGQGCSLMDGVSSISFYFWWFLMLFWFGFVPKVWALRADHYLTNMDGKGILNYESAKTLPQNAFAAGLSTHLVQDPLGFGVTQTGQSLDSVVNFFWVWDFWGAYAFRKDLEIGLHLPISLFTQVEDLNSNIERNTTSLGDIRLNAKWSLLKEVAVIPFLEIPTGAEGDFFGEANMTGGAKVVGEHPFGAHTLGGELGFFGRGKETVQASGLNLLEVGPEMLWGVAWRWAFSRDQGWEVASHLWGKTDFGSEATSPTELDFGLKKDFEKSPFAATFGFGFGLNKGYGAPASRLIFGIQHTLGEK